MTEDHIHIIKYNLGAMASPKDKISQYLDQSHERIFENNRNWVSSKKQEDPAFFEKLAAGQAPEYL